MRCGLIVAGVLAMGPGPAAWARTLLTQDQALAVAFGDKHATKETATLTEEERAAAAKAARAPVESRDWTWWVATSSSGARSYAYFDTHVVRTMPETVLVALDAAGKVRFVELVQFHEPEDYKPPKRWLKQLDGQGLDGELFVRRGIRNITGASLTSEALTQSVRRVLAVHQAFQRRRGAR